MSSNLSKTFKYVNANGDSITFEPAYGFIISKPNGIDTLSVTLNESVGIDQVGSTVMSSNVQSRPITVSGRLIGDFQSENKEKLLSVVRPDLTAKLYADDYYLPVYVTATPTISPSLHNANFQFSVKAPYPYWQKDDSVQATLAGVVKRFKFPWKINANYQYGEIQQNQFIYIKNSGQVSIPFTVTFTASSEVKNPKLVDASTNKFLRLKKTMAAGERVIVEITHERTNVTSSVDGECRGALDLKSSFFRIGVGTNTLKPDADSGKDNLQVTIDFSTEMVGISL